MATRYPVEAFAGPRAPSELYEVFLEMGWDEQFVAIVTPAQNDVALVRLGEPEKPRIIVVASEHKHTSEAVSLGYSGEADFTVRWRRDRISLLETTRWSSAPGDVEAWAADTQQKASLSNFVSLLGPGRAAELSLAALRSDRGVTHPSLSRRLGQALATLRMRVFESAAWENLDPEARDVEVLRVFHRLLYVRFHEDRHGALTELRLTDLLDTPKLDEQLADLLNIYEAELDSSLFEQRLEPLRLPPHAWRDVIRSVTEPWETLQLDFSVSTSDLAGRLYQSYLEQRPKIDVSTERLFATAETVDERLVRGAYYTPIALSARLVDTALGGWLTRRQPTEFSQVSVLDPACGSGAFLLSAYRRLLRYFTDLRERPLSTQERAKLLTTSLFGADSDESALLLARIQLLEEADVGRQELPELEANFAKGDSLLGRPGREQNSGIGWERWMETRGRKFDVVLMNPPFMSQRSLGHYMAKEKRKQLREVYDDIWAWGGDLAYFFVALAYDLLEADGAAGVVLPRAAISASSGGPVRQLLADDVIDVLDLRGVLAFGRGVSSYVVLISLLRGRARGDARFSSPASGAASLREVLGSRDDGKPVIDLQIGPRQLAELPAWTAFLTRYQTQVRPRLRVNLERLVTESSSRCLVQGTQTGANRAYIIDEQDVNWTPDGQAVVRGHRISARRLPRLVKGGDIGAMRLRKTGLRLFLPFDRPHDLGPLDATTIALIEDLGGSPRNPQPGDLGVLLGPKVLMRGMAREPTAAVEPSGRVITIKGAGGGLALALGPDAETFHVVGAATLLNSAFCQWWLQGMGDPKQGGWVDLRQSVVEALPWPNPTDEAWKGLARIGTQLAESYKIGDPLRRTMAYDKVRWELDEFAFDLYGVPSSVVEMIMSEVIRTA